MRWSFEFGSLAWAGVMELSFGQPVVEEEEEMHVVDAEASHPVGFRANPDEDE